MSPLKARSLLKKSHMAISSVVFIAQVEKIKVVITELQLLLLSFFSLMNTFQQESNQIFLYVK
jgi:hypothetical protein